LRFELRLVGLAEIFSSRFFVVSWYGHFGLGAGDSQASCELTGAELALYFQGFLVVLF
jgi:hypothetical protein